MINDVNINNQPINTIPSEVDITKLQNQKAIECLKEVKEKINELICQYHEKYYSQRNHKFVGYYFIEEQSLSNFIDNKIKELEGEK